MSVAIVQALDRILDDHDGGIDDQADGNSEPAEAHEVGRHAEGAHHGKRNQRRKGERDRDNQSSPEVAEEGQ